MTKEEVKMSPEARDALAALKRAAQLARQIAIQTDTDIIISEDGKMVRVTAAELRQQAAALAEESAIQQPAKVKA